MAKVEIKMGEIGGGADISDLIGNTYKWRTANGVYYGFFVVGINSISIVSSGTDAGQMRDSGADTGTLLATITSTPSTVDVSSYNVVFIKGTANSNQDYNITVVS